MSNATRRGALALAGGALASLAGCSATGSSDGCSPAYFPEGTATREEPPEPCQFLAQLDAAGLETDSHSSLTDGDAGVFYHHRPDKHRADIRTIAVEFVPYRRMIDRGLMLTFTALESDTEREGVGHIAREWADSRASGKLTEKEYVQMVVDTYAQR